MIAKTDVLTALFENQTLDSLNNLVRWQGVPTLKKETVAEHSFNVVLFTAILLESIFPTNHNANACIKQEVLMRAILHDFDEIFTGDVNHNVKRNKLNGKAITRELDWYADKMMLKMFGDNSVFDEYFVKPCHDWKKTLVKLADWFSMAHYCKRERSMGNKNLDEHYDNCVRLIQEYSYMLQQQIPAFYDTDKSIFTTIENMKFYEKD